jgi:hypothetical protein
LAENIFAQRQFLDQNGMVRIPGVTERGKLAKMEENGARSSTLVTPTDVLPVWLVE